MLGRAVAVSGALTAVWLSLLPIVLSTGIEAIGWHDAEYLASASVEV